MSPRVAVVGVGTMGSMALWRLAQRGVEAIGFEQFGAGHDRGAAGGETRIFRTAYLEGPEYVPLLQAAYRGWRELEGETGLGLLDLTGGLTIGDPGAETMRQVLESITRFDLEHEVLDQAAAQARFPQHRLSTGEEMILERQAGMLRPEVAVLAAVRRAEQLGAVVHRHTTVEAIEQGDGHAVVHAGGERHVFDKVISAAGPWTGLLLDDWEPRLEVRRLVMTWFASADPPAFAPDRFPVFTRRWEGTDLFGLPSVDGRTVKVSLAGAAGEVHDPRDLDPRVPAEELDTISEVVTELLPTLLPEPVRAHAYMDAFTPDLRPVISAPSPTAVLLCGFSGHGFKLAPVIGEIAADLATHGKTSHDTRAFELAGA
jgi:sarcosine oxidase